MFALGVLLWGAYPVWAVHVGKFMYRHGPEDYVGPKFNGTVTVNDTMVAMSEIIRVMAGFFKDSIMDTPAIFFLMDHSNSMSYGSNSPIDPMQPNDQNGNRFKVPSAFIELLGKKFPSAEIGYAVFQGSLYYRTKDDPLFKAFPTTDDADGAYVPFYKLNKTYNGQTGLAILKHFLETKPTAVPGGINGGFAPGTMYEELSYTPSTEAQGGTNINVAFDAAKDAFTNAVQKIKECHYIIFLSDGDANAPYSETNAFVKGTNVPTTFTIYFTRDTVVPPNLVTMTTNIQTNNYSLSNPKSHYWPFLNTNFDKLMTFLIENILDSISTMTPVLPKSFIVGGETANNWNQVDSTFTFNTLFPLTGNITPFNYQIKYPTKKGVDTTHVIDFFVRTLAGTDMPANDFEVKLWDRNIKFLYNNTVITVAYEAMGQLELQFPWDGGTAGYKYNNVSIELSTVVPPVDHETIPLVSKPGVNLFSASFKRASEVTKTANNGVIENSVDGEDSIIAVFRNNESPKLPLDTLRVGIVVNPPVFLNTAITQDSSGNGYLDHIVLFFDKPIAIPPTAVSSFLIQCYGTTFLVDSMHKIGDSIYVLCLQEQTKTGLQTSWTPTINMSSIPGVKSVTGFLTLDGAPPVIETVVKTISDPLDHKTDVVEVTMSEKVYSQGKVKLTPSNQPVQTFNAWIRPAPTTFTLVPNMFENITNFTSVLYDSVLIFFMTNNRDLNNNNWVNIKGLPTYKEKPLCDGKDNFPTDSNRKVRVRVISPPVVITVFPNPSGPSTKYVPDGNLIFKHEPNAVKWVYDDNAGTVFSLKNVVLPGDGQEPFKGYLKIYDVIGNVVNWASASSDSIFKDIADPGSPVPEMNIYWNGLNNRGMTVAPGVYRAVVYLDYPPNSEGHDKKFHVKAGIRPATTP